MINTAKKRKRKKQFHDLKDSSKTKKYEKIEDLKYIGHISWSNKCILGILERGKKGEEKYIKT